MAGKQHFTITPTGSVMISANAFYDKQVDATTLAISEEIAKKQMHPSFYRKDQLPNGIDQLVEEDKSAGVICLAAIEILKRHVNGKDGRLHTIHLEPVHDTTDTNTERAAAHLEIRYSPYFESNKGQRQLSLLLATVANMWFRSHGTWGREPIPMPTPEATAA